MEVGLAVMAGFCAFFLTLKVVETNHKDAWDALGGGAFAIMFGVSLGLSLAIGT